MVGDFREFINEKVWDYLPPSKVKVGREIHVRCPVCGDSKKNPRKKRGYYSLDKAAYYCFNCGASMSGIGLLKIIAGQDFEDIRDEYRRIKMKTGGNLSADLSSFAESGTESSIKYLNNLQSVVKPEWKNPLSKTAVEYLEHRKVLDAPFLKDRLYSVFDKKMQEYILIPWKINGIEAYYQLNDFEHHDRLGRKYIFPSNREKLIYGLDNIDLTFPYIICFEGVYDSVFIPNAVAIGGKSLTKLQREIITKRYPSHQIVLSYDNDEAGISAMVKQIRKNPNDFMYFKWFDENTAEKDVNDYVVSRNDISLLADKGRVREMIVGSGMMKMYLLQTGEWTKNG